MWQFTGLNPLDTFSFDAHITMKHWENVFILINQSTTFVASAMVITSAVGGAAYVSVTHEAHVKKIENKTRHEQNYM